MAKRKTNEERIQALKDDINTIEERRATDLRRLQEKKRILGELETEEVMKEVRAYHFSPSELKEFLSKYAGDLKEDPSEGNQSPKNNTSDPDSSEIE